MTDAGALAIQTGENAGKTSDRTRNEVSSPRTSLRPQSLAQTDDLGCQRSSRGAFWERELMVSNVFAISRVALSRDGRANLAHSAMHKLWQPRS
jgi:hypothetical protein